MVVKTIEKLEIALVMDTKKENKDLAIRNSYTGIKVDWNCRRAKS